MISHLASAKVQAVFHYVPLHTAVGGQKFGRFHGEDRYTTVESERLIRLPIWYGMSDEEVSQVIDSVSAFCNSQ